MNSQEKALLRKFFKLKIHESEGSSFETLFTEIMNYAEPNFQQIEPWGNIGDRKNDGFIRSKGIYYQVFSPKDIRKSYPEAVKKIKDDFSGLLKHWSPVNEYYFLINDKYKGVNADAEQELNLLLNENNLSGGGILTAKGLERITFSLEDDEIQIITGFLPDLNLIAKLDFSILNQVIGHIMKLPISPKSGKIKFPDWDEKIQFNKLSPYTKRCLDFASQKLGALNQYLDNEPFLAEELQKQLIGIYAEVLSKPIATDEEEHMGDYTFWEIAKKISPKNESTYEAAVMTIISKYFESCDLFEDPNSE
jgi:hypothetical protein